MRMNIFVVLVSQISEIKVIFSHDTCGDEVQLFLENPVVLLRNWGSSKCDIFIFAIPTFGLPR